MGQTFELEDHRISTTSAASTPIGTPVPNPLPQDASAERAMLAGYKVEIKGYRDQLATDLESMDTTEAMRVLSSVAARLRVIHSALWDMRGQAAANLRNHHVDPLRDDLEYHFKTHSRQLEALKFEWEMSRGQ